MKKGYLYLVFMTLSFVVVLSITLVFKLTTTTENTKLTTSINDSGTNKLKSLIAVEDYEDSWIQKITKEKNQKEYLYPVQKFHIEFN